MSEQDDETTDSTKGTADDTSTDDTDQDDGTDTDNNDNSDDSSADDGNAEVERLKKQNQKLFERAKKAEGFERQPDGSWVKVTKKPTPKPEAKPSNDAKSNDVQITPMDTILLSKANLTEKEDIEFVLEYAQFKKVPVSDALKSNIVKSELAERAEQRQTANATNTGNARRGTSKPSSEQIISNAAKGKLPDDPADLVAAEMDMKFTKK
jgi:hypothetical protein